MAEKCVYRLLIKDLYARMCKFNDVMQRKAVQQEMLLNNQSQMQLRSFLDISINSAQNFVMTKEDEEEATEEIR